MQDLYRKIVTQIFMGCTSGCAVSEAQILFGSVDNDSGRVIESVDYINGKSEQKLYSINVFEKIERKNQNLTRNNLGISDASFCIVIMGNRLDDELSEEFKNMLKILLTMSADYHLVIIGKTNPEILKGFSTEQYSLLGYRVDYVDVIALSDLVVNPPRQGGGGVASAACALGIPVVSLKNCDVSNVIGEDLCVTSFDEMVKMIEQYRNSTEIYQKRSMEMRALYEKRKVNAINNPDTMRQYLTQIETDIMKGIVK